MLNRILLFLLMLCSQPMFALENQLIAHPSPYLAMHAQDPVHWQDWRPELLEQAQKEGKLLFISSGYFACHWCHVMRRESYNNGQIAALLNTHFIPVKLDRELEPALDAHLIDFVQRTQGQAGWPLNVFITPQGYPLIGLTYLPPQKFQQLLERLNQLWTEQPVETAAMAQSAMQALVQQRAVAASEKLPSLIDLRAGFITTALQIGDSMQGGFGQANKFPMTPQLALLLELQASAPDKRIAEFLTLTLDQMAQNGLRDHLGGGFYRYTVDPDWQTPHYEKMLYTQALLAQVYLRASVVLQRDDYRQLAIETLRFVLRDMAGADGAYIASFSAVDGNDVEGGYYLWSDDELKQTLKGEMLALARRHWRLQPSAGESVLPMQGSSISELAASTSMPEAQVRSLLDEARKKLLQQRSTRVLPRDDKELAGWNGLLLAALADAAGQLQLDDLKQAAGQLRNKLLANLWDGNRLRRAASDREELGAAALEDYAYVAWGLTQWATLADNEADHLLARKMLNLAWQRFHGADGWRATDAPPLPGMPLDRAQDDGALPSAAAMIIGLSIHSGDTELRERAMASRAGVLAAIRDKPFWYAGHIRSLMQ